MSLDGKGVAVRPDLVEMAGDFAIDFERMGRLSFDSTRPFRRLCNYVGEVIQVYIHAGYVTESLPLNR